MLRRILIISCCAFGISSSAHANDLPIDAVVNVDLIPAKQVVGSAMLKNFVEHARQDHRLQSVRLVQQLSGPNHFILIETIASQSAYNDYVQSEYVRHFRDSIYPLLGSPWDERLGQEQAAQQ